jgi:TonB-linked SusC/RagA family outer membrane protein
MMSKFRKRCLKQLFTRVKMLFILALAFQVSLFGQEKQIKGTVNDASGSPLPGVNVTIKGTVTGTVTDIDGKYSIMASPQDVLVFSFVGYLAEEYKVEANTVLDVSLDEDVIGLDEVVVIGYGTQKKKLNTGATLNKGSEEIQSLNTSSTMDALKGVSPGLTVIQRSGVPGSSSKINIRGIGTIGTYAPLYIVDGVSVGNIDYLSPSDIESVDILKDAASSAIYGSRAANGVILVTTKKGVKGSKVSIAYDGYYGWQNVYNPPKLLNATQYIEIMQEARAGAGKKAYDFSKMDCDYDKILSGEWNGTNWFDEITDKNAPVTNHSLNITGGGERSSYSLGASYRDQQGVLGKQVNNDYKRITLRLNSDHILWQKNGRDILTFGENLTYTNEKKPTIRASGSIYWNDIHNMLTTSPLLAMWADSTGDLAYPHHFAIKWNSGEGNPVAAMENQAKYNTNNNNTILGNAYLELQPIKNLRIRSAFGVNNWYSSSQHWTPAFALSNVSSNVNDQVDQSMYSGFTWTSTNTMTYTYSLRNAHNFSAMVGAEYTRNARALELTGHNEDSQFNDPNYAYLDNVTALTNARIGGRDNFGWAMASYFGRLSYDYKEKYLLTLVMRADGSSNFKQGHRWGTFPSISAGWIVTNESFMNNFTNWLSYLKVRGSWGQNGNQDILKYQYLSTLTFTDAYYYFGTGKGVSSFNTGYYPARVPNYDVGWETSEQLDLGTDIYFMRNQLQFSFDWYKKDTKNWLLLVPSLTTDGTQPAYSNGGHISNKGVELMLSWNSRVGGFKYGVTASLAYNKNKVVDIPNDEGIIHGPSSVLSQGTTEMFRAQTGYPVGYFWGFETAGIFQDSLEAVSWVGPTGEQYYPKNQKAGDVRFVDQNNDGQISTEDKVMIGDPNPDYVFGLQISAEYKGIYLQATGNGQAGHQIAKSYRSFADSYQQNYTTDVYNRWHGPGTSNKMPRLVGNSQEQSEYFRYIY